MSIFQKDQFTYEVEYDGEIMQITAKPSYPKDIDNMKLALKFKIRKEIAALAGMKDTEIPLSEIEQTDEFTNAFLVNYLNVFILAPFPETVNNAFGEDLGKGWEYFPDIELGWKILNGYLEANVEYLEGKKKSGRPVTADRHRDGNGLVSHETVQNPAGMDDQSGNSAALDEKHPDSARRHHKPAVNAATDSDPKSDKMGKVVRRHTLS